jgi:hypothetical protein
MHAKINNNYGGINSGDFSLPGMHAKTNIFVETK